MPIEPPPGYLTRPEAAKHFNRSQRALERGLDEALRVGDQDVLSHFTLVTKDGREYAAADVTIEQVKELMADGMTPTWCVEAAWLETTYGRRGEEKPKPAASRVGAEPTEPEEGSGPADEDDANRAGFVTVASR